MAREYVDQKTPIQKPDNKILFLCLNQFVRLATITGCLYTFYVQWSAIKVSIDFQSAWHYYMGNSVVFCI